MREKTANLHNHFEMEENENLEHNIAVAVTTKIPTYFDKLQPSADHIPLGISLSSHLAQDNERSLPKLIDKVHSFQNHRNIHFQNVGSNELPSSSTKQGSEQKLRRSKGIYLSYSPDATFLERQFVANLARQLNETMADDLWFDKDAACLGMPTWFSQRIEAVERCQAAIVVLTDSYFTCPISMYESRTFLERQLLNPDSVKVFPVLYSKLGDITIPKMYDKLVSSAVDLTLPAVAKLSVAEKASLLIGAIIEELESYANGHTSSSVPADADAEFNGEYKTKKLCQWSVSNLQEWLFTIGVKEFYRQSFAESMIDGFLLVSITEKDMSDYLGIDSQVVRKKIMQQILNALEREHRLESSWHLRARNQKSRVNTIYLVYDPADVRMAQTFKQDLAKKGLQVVHHHKLGQSKDEFLSHSGPLMATSTYVLLLLTESSVTSPFLFHETLFAVWLGKKRLVAVFKNVWRALRPCLRAILGDCSAVDFERVIYNDSLDVLVHHIKPMHSLPGVVLEQSYLNKMAAGLKPLSVLATGQAEAVTTELSESNSLVFISYQWDMQSKVEEIMKHVEEGGYKCWSDSGARMRGRSSLSSRSGIVHSQEGVVLSLEGAPDTLQSSIQRSMRSAVAVLCCITPKYLQSDNCLKDLALAESLQKPIIPLLLRFSNWPPEGTPPSVRKTLARCSDLVELYNDKLFKQNLTSILVRLHRITVPDD